MTLKTESVEWVHHGPKHKCMKTTCTHHHMFAASSSSVIALSCSLVVATPSVSSMNRSSNETVLRTDRWCKTDSSIFLDNLLISEMQSMLIAFNQLFWGPKLLLPQSGMRKRTVNHASLCPSSAGPTLLGAKRLERFLSQWLLGLGFGSEPWSRGGLPGCLSNASVLKMTSACVRLRCQDARNEHLQLHRHVDCWSWVARSQ